MRSSTCSLLAWSRQLACKSTDAVNLLFQCIRQVHGFPAALPEVSAEAAGAAARRSVPLLRLPSDLEGELAAVLADRGVKPKEARRLGMELTERLKSLSHTPQRGGFGPASATSAPSHSGGRLRGAELLAAREAFEAGEMLSMDDRAVNAALGLPPPLRDDQRHAPQMQKLAPKYKSEEEVVAYVVARMAPEYAVCRRVLEEAVRLLEAAGGAAEAAPRPGVGLEAGASAGKWRPREALVHGAGVGAAVLAALEACAASPSLTRIVALEPSPLRQMLGTRVEQAHRAKLQQELGAAMGEVGRSAAGDRRGRRHQAGTGPLVSWVQALPPLTKAAAAQRRRYDLVVAPYQLTVLPTVEERQRLVRELWDRCGDVLVLVEPGTPRGFAAIAEARELVLGREGRKRAHLEAAASGSSAGAHHQARGAGGGGAGAVDPRVMDKLKGTGAHVVAPCPHDGTCPMLGRKRDWCHFSQPLLLPSYMQAAMVPPADKAGGRGHALNVQDERFSYVVLRRGRRPGLRVAVSRDYEDAAAAAAAGGGGRDYDGGRGPVAPPSTSPMLPSRLPPRVVLSQVMLNRAATETGSSLSGGALTTAVATASAAERVAEGSHGHVRDGSTGAASQRTASRRAPLFSSRPPPADDIAVPYPESPSAGRTSGTLGDGGAVALSASALDAAGGVAGAGPATSAFARKYPAYGPGLVGRLIALQDAGVNWAAPSEDEQQEDGEVPAEAETAAGTAPSRYVGAPGPVAMETAAAVAGGGGGGGSDGSSARSHGLDSAMAELSFTILGGGVSPLASRRDADASQDHTPRPLSSPSAWPDNGPSPELVLEPAGTGEAYDGGSRRPLTRDDVSEAEYDAAERQLVERIYGAQAAAAWLAARRGADGDGALGDADGADGVGEEYDSEGKAVEVVGGLELRLEEEALAGVVGGVAARAAPLGLDAAAAAAGGGGRDVDADEEGEEGLQLERGDLDAASAEIGREQGGSASASCRLAEASSYGWGRLVRSPRLRGGHVILDMCVGPQHHYPDAPSDGPARDHGTAETTTMVTTAQEAELRDAAATISSGPEDPMGVRPQGRLVQQVVARSSRRGWMGAPAYRLARRLSWGDVWPDWYIRSHNTREAGAAAGATTAAAAAEEAAAAAARSGVGLAAAAEPRLGGRKVRGSGNRESATGRWGGETWR